MAKLTPEVLSPDRMRNAAGSQIFQRGEAYYAWGRVRIESLQADAARCYVQGKHLYEVTIQVANNYLYLRCECPYSLDGSVCKHEVAAALAVYNHLRETLPPHWSERLSKLVPSSRSSSRKSTPGQYLLAFSLQQRYLTSYYSSSGWHLLPYRITVNSVPKELRQEITALRADPAALNELLKNNADIRAEARQASSAMNLAGCLNLGQEAVLLANLIIERERSYYYTSSPNLHSHLGLIRSLGSPLFTGVQAEPLKRPLAILDEPASLHVKLTRDEEGLHLTGRLAAGEAEIPLGRQGTSALQVLNESPLWLMEGDQVFQMEDDSQALILDEWLRQGKLTIPLEEENDFLDRFYLNLAQNAYLESDFTTWETVEEQPVPRVYLSDSKGKLQAELRFGYGEYELAYDSGLNEEKVVRKPGGWTLARIYRQPEIEEACYKALSDGSYRLKRAPKPAPTGLFMLRANAHPVDFLMHSIPRLANDGFEIYGEEQLKTLQVNRNQPKLTFTVSSGIDWFDVQAVVNYGELEVSLKDIRKALRKKERYIKLADGTVGEIPQEWLERYKHLFNLGEETQGGLRLANSQITLLDQVLAGAEHAHFDPEFERRREHLRSFSGIQTVPLPEGFVGELRPYQKAGYDWLHFLHEFEFGGCLADDMGLGKTVQVLVYLQSLKEGLGPGRPEAQPKASLIVVPRSLLINWQREAARFTPELKILEYFNGSRTRNPADFDEYDAIITTYGVLLRDIELLKEYPFHYAILDESQAIKNPVAQTAKAARMLRPRHRLVLTGTPVENSTVELWSQFAFLNPGLLGNLDYFTSEFASPIEKKGDAEAAQFLRRMVFPFILRRTKDQVAPELPPRSERILYADMEPAQRKLYNRTRDYYRGYLLGMIEEEGMNNTRMKILEGLLRLRQIANHPLLFDEKFRGESGKFDLLLETLETLRTEGHKALVFSQFVSMLHIVRCALDNQKVPYTYLDGQTQNRQEQVDRFQNDPDIPLFLISLKAGGLGLNLTSADYVIHIDPWWNPAVEMQATDRTHRIGQDKPVFVYKLIARDSVEEKILQLQERKKNLVDQLITVESSFFKDLTSEDVQTLFS